MAYGTAQFDLNGIVQKADFNPLDRGPAELKHLGSVFGVTER